MHEGWVPSLPPTAPPLRKDDLDSPHRYIFSESLNDRFSGVDEEPEGSGIAALDGYRFSGVDEEPEGSGIAALDGYRFSGVDEEPEGSGIAALDGYRFSDVEEEPEGSGIAAMDGYRFSDVEEEPEGAGIAAQGGYRLSGVEEEPEGAGIAARPGPGVYEAGEQWWVAGLPGEETVAINSVCELPGNTPASLGRAALSDAAPDGGDMVAVRAAIMRDICRARRAERKKVYRRRIKPYIAVRYKILQAHARVRKRCKGRFV